MKYLIKILSISLIITLISCAKQSTPMGGPRDEEPPKLLSITPSNESINIKPSIIELEFDEYVQVENANKQIIITPRIKKEEMEVTPNRNRVIIKLNQELEDSTTYVFNFQKTIKDITEKNTPENLKLVFSTGPEIDSLKFSGNVSYIFPPRDPKMKDVFVGLYEISDTTDVLTAPPYYIAAADSTGNFTLTNIKAGSYKAYAWHDDNNSLKAEEKQEAYAFIKDTVSITNDLQGVQFYLSKADISEFKVTRSSTIGSNFDVILSKYPVDIKIEHDQINKGLYYRQNDKTLRFYHTELVNDSTAIRLHLRDSVGFKVDTLIYAKFEESDRKKEVLETAIEGKKTFVEKLQTELKFNKPIARIQYDSLFFKYDTASIVPIQKEWIYIKDSTDLTKLIIAWQVPDSISNETFNFFAADSTFFDVENQTNEKKVESAYKRLKKETLAEEIQVKVNTTHLPIIVQILTTKEELIAEQYITDSNQAVFTYVEPGTYNIRAILDLNKNGRWDTSNMKEGRQAEPVYYLENINDNNSRETTIRGGWVLDLMIEPYKKAGLPEKQAEEIDPKQENDTENQKNIVDN
jgi:hypothetical protein